MEELNIKEFINRDEEMKLTEELWQTFGFEKYYNMGWRLMFEDLTIYFEKGNFPNTVEQLLMIMRDYYVDKGQQLGTYNTKKHLREFLEIKEC